MANLVISRSDRYPVGTTVEVFEGATNRHHEGKPSGSAVATATVDATGKLTVPGLKPNGVYTLYAEVAGRPVNTLAGAAVQFQPLGTLMERIRALRKLLGT